MSNELEIWKAAAMSAKSECYRLEQELESQKKLNDEILSLDDFSSSYTLKAERDDLAAKAAALDALIVAMQARAAAYIEPDGESDDTFISAIIGLLDGPEQRAAQATPAQCLANVRAEAGRAGYLQGLEDGKAFLPDDEQCAKWANQYAEQIRQGGAK